MYLLFTIRRRGGRRGVGGRFFRWSFRAEVVREAESPSERLNFRVRDEIMRESNAC